MNVDIPTALEAMAGGITALSGLYAGWRHLRYGIQAKRDKERQAILDRANEELAKVESKLDLRIRLLQEEIESHKENLNKDLIHMREIYNAEIKTLGEKIDNLRQDLSEQHSSMVALLTKLVSKP